MAGYFGTSDQQRLQARAEKHAAIIAATHGACQAGRMLGCDDADALGWDRIEAILASDGVLGFRLLPAGRLGDVEAGLAARGYRLDRWDLFLAGREAVLAACEPIVAAGLPAGFAELGPFLQPEGADLRRVQRLMVDCGIVPFSGSLLVGQVGPAVTVALADRHGEVAATAHCYLPHNEHSSHHRYAWGGLVAVSGACRGLGLGRYINARMLVAACGQLGASHVYELVSADNVASRRMVAACGLRHDPDLVCGVATAAVTRFSR
jgi:hypothetical protein